MSGARTSAPVAIVAGGGGLPAEVAAAAREAGRKVIVFRIDGEADRTVDGVESHTLSFGQVGRLFAMLNERGCRDIVFVGTIRRRPDYLAIASDFGTLRRLPKILRALSGGDDTVIRKLLRIIEEEGYRVLPIAEVAPSLLAPEGQVGGVAVAAEETGDLMLGREVLGAVSRFDIGQAVVVIGGRVVALEAAEGTDAMLARIAALRKDGRVRAAKRRGVLVKMAKRGQDLRTDLPVIGADTVGNAAAAGLAGIAVEAGRTLIAERRATVAAADRAGLFVVGTHAA